MIRPAVVAGALGAAVLTGCGLLPVGIDAPPRPGLITERRAVELATDGHPTANRVRAVFTPAEASGIGSDTWTVSMSLDERRACGQRHAPDGGAGADPANICHIQSRTVTLDARDGKVIGSEESGSTGP